MTRRIAVNDEGERQPWEQQPRESDAVYGYFLRYRDMGFGKRSLRLLAKEVERAVPTVEAASHRWKWQARVQAWDSNEQRTLDARAMMERGQMLTVHGRAANNLLLTAQKMISPPKKEKGGRALTDEERHEWRPSGLALQAATVALDKAIHHQRLAAGLPTDITRQDIMVRQQLQEAVDVNKALIMLLQEHMCDECRPGAIYELERLAERNATAQGFIEAGATVGPAA